MSERLFMSCFSLQGLKSEGLYRISGFSDSVEEVKMAFDKGIACVFLIHSDWLTLPVFVCLYKTHSTFQVNERVTHFEGIIDFILTGPSQAFTVWTDRGNLRGYKPWMYSHCFKHKTLPRRWDSAVDLVRMSLSWPSAVWILTIRKPCSSGLNS